MEGDRQAEKLISRLTDKKGGQDRQRIFVGG